LAKIGEAQSKEGVIGLMSEMIAGTEYEKRLLDFKNKRKIAINNENQVLGKAWYNGFMKRNKEKLKRGKCKIKDIKRNTWVTYENFSNMYDCVYDSMVEAGIAEKVEEELLFDRHGVEVDCIDNAFGKPTKYRMLKPENVVFVDETGCNTNQKEDGNVGGKLFILPVDYPEAGVTGCCTDIHFSVLCFT
jgi:hypothetical protein